MKHMIELSTEQVAEVCLLVCDAPDREAHAGLIRAFYEGLSRGVAVEPEPPAAPSSAVTLTLSHPLLARDVLAALGDRGVYLEARAWVLREKGHDTTGLDLLISSALTAEREVRPQVQALEEQRKQHREAAS